ncbi:site-specific DNA-methyltransferase [Desulfonema ishimotonii]|uniref:Methyltransferase n=2 Tax=Desulfonema ishimotonii TaxID=45657 RepID=A0A401FWB1_9BACT|nr:site-specific DNA-methyltransferase [Desulfonema ishimotonii]
MITAHRICFEDAKKMDALSAASADLVVTSPPYPMIGMWDETFVAQDSRIGAALDAGEGRAAFEAMHRVLGPVWEALYRVLRPGGIACINIGDATRTLNGHFMLYPNHAEILRRMMAAGFTPLPSILWRKQTNAPNKFMGSGMLPAGAYVTLEHEHILIFRKGGKREFKTADEKRNRRESALFWEERNLWFSDIWTDLKGARQKMADRTVRLRNGAFPFEMPYRLIHMFSVRGDTVLDPFLGTGTTLAAAMAAGRNSVGFEVESALWETIRVQARGIVPVANERLEARLRNHRAFVRERAAQKGPLKHVNAVCGFPVVTRQEAELYFTPLTAVRETGECRFEVAYEGQVAGGVPSFT